MLPIMKEVTGINMQTLTNALTAIDIAALQVALRSRLASLRVDAVQEDLGGTFKGSLSEWEAATPRDILGLGFFLGNEPVGIVLLKRPPLSPDWVNDDSMSLHGLKIAADWQGRGLGRAAFGLALQQGRAKWPEIKQLALAVDAGNEPALAVYRGYGMTDSGPVFRGRIGLEHRLELTFQDASTSHKEI